MASWLKVAEDLLEVVDRRAKLVVNELSDEQSELKPPVSSGQELQAKRTKSTGNTISKILQVQLKSSSLDSHKLNDNSEDQISNKASGDDALPDKDKLVLSSENDGNMSTGNIDHTVKAAETELGQVSTPSEVTIPDSVSNDMGEKDVSVKMEVPSIVNGLETASPVQVELTTKTTTDEQKEGLSSDSPATGVDTVDKEPPADPGQDIRLENEDNSQKIDHAEPVVADVETHGNTDGQADDAYTKEPSFASKKQHESKAEIPTEKVQDQLDEAQGLLKSTNSTGQSKEARLARVCAGLSSRLQEYKSENAQLEELLTTERERSNAYETRIKQLLKDFSASKVEVSRVESHMSEALAAKNSEIDALVNSLDTLKKQATASEEKLTSLQENMESLMRNRELSETRMMQALREELASVEHRAEEERAAHHATKKAAMEREVELEHRAVEAATALARMQRAVDERTSKVAELEQKVAFLETESATLNQELQDMETRARRGQMKLADEGNQVLQMQAWQEEVDRARQGQREAEKNISSLEAEVQKMRVEIAGMKRDAEHYSRQEHMELEKRYRELTDLLYHKQTQLETMASEKAAAEFQLEKEVRRLQEAQVEAEKNRAHRRTSSSFWEEDNADLKSLEPLPLHHRHIAGGSLQLQKAVKLLDSGAVSATRFLWRYPVARVILMFYMVFVHLFLMYLLHRLQAQADKFAAREVAASMGLTPP